MTNELTTVAAATENGVVADLAEKAATRQLVELVDGRFVALVHDQNQSVATFDLEKYDETPSAKTGTVATSDADSFATYVERHQEGAATTLWSNIDKGTVTAVLDDHERTDGSKSGSPRWGRHRAVLQLKNTKDWLHWLATDGRYMDQSTFAEHIEDGVDAISDPTPAEMLEVAQTFHAKTGVNFESSRRLSGEVEFTYAETVQAKAGEKGKLEVPQIFTLAVAPFEGNDAYSLQARFRFRLSNGNLALGYRLIRPDRVLRAAFDDLVKEIAGATDLPVMAGTPRSQ
jgi:uncharacterized protein YfdQ (DUF2303 family)